MTIASLALIVTVPMQFSGAAGVEVAGGYDSTVLNQTTNQYNAGAIARLAVDIQAGHRTETFQHTLRTRGEFYYPSGEGRDLGSSDLTLINRYRLLWEPTDNWRISGEGFYNLGQNALLLGRTGSTDLVFQRGVFGEYGGQVDVARQFGETWRAVLSFGVQGRHVIDQPPDFPRNNTQQWFALLSVDKDLTENDVLGVAVRGEYFLVDGFLDWIGRATAYATYRRSWSENVTTQLSAGLDLLQDQNDPSQWNAGPYVNAGYAQLFPDANMALTVNAGYEFALVTSARCNTLELRRRFRDGRIPDGTPCPPELVTFGGTGRVASAAVQWIWHPREQDLVFSASVQGDYGITANNTPTNPGVATDAVMANLVTTLNARYVLTRGVSFFANYSFFYQYLDDVAAPRLRRPDGDAILMNNFFRHVVLAGITLSVSGGDGPQLDGVVPLTEVEALQNFRSMNNNEQQAGSSANGDSNTDDLIPADTNLNDPNIQGFPAPPPGARPGTTRPSTNPSTTSSTRPTTAPSPGPGRAPASPPTPNDTNNPPSDEPPADPNEAPADGAQGESR